jgi:glycosyltransferase involved in cell wall biosynthesis
VVIPTRNRAALLGRAVRSVLEQTFADFELFVVDDGSTDATPETVRRFTDPRIRTLRQDHAGVSTARNAAIAEARGDWVAFLDDDNEWLPTYLERQLQEAAKMREPGAVYCIARWRSPDGHTTSFPARRPVGDVFGDLVRAWGPLISATMVRRALLLEFGGFCPDLEWGEDRDLMMNVALRAPFAGNPDALVVRHEHLEPRATWDPERRLRSVHVLDRRWRGEVRTRMGVRGDASWTRCWLLPTEIPAMSKAAQREGRIAAARTLRRLVPRLPSSADACARATVLLVVGPARYARAARARNAVREGRRGR